MGAPSESGLFSTKRIMPSLAMHTAMADVWLLLEIFKRQSRQSSLNSQILKISKCCPNNRDAMADQVPFVADIPRQAHGELHEGKVTGHDRLVALRRRNG